MRGTQSPVDGPREQLVRASVGLPGNYFVQTNGWVLVSRKKTGWQEIFNTN